jgi:hypothetical protein
MQMRRNRLTRLGRAASLTLVAALKEGTGIWSASCVKGFQKKIWTDSNLRVEYIELVSVKTNQVQG